jgi:hypothetical protein
MPGVHERHVAALLGQERQRGGHVPADRLPGDRHAAGIQALGGTFANDPLAVA